MSSPCGNPKVSVFFWVLFCGVGWLLAGLCLWGCENPGASGQGSMARVHFLDVGQGLSVLLEQDGRFALYDAGPDSLGVWDSLRFRGVDTLEWVIISHNHRDHGGGLLELLEAGEGDADNGKALGEGRRELPEGAAQNSGKVPRVFIRRL